MEVERQQEAKNFKMYGINSKRRKQIKKQNSKSN